MNVKILFLALLSGFATAQTTLENQMKTYTKKVDSIVISEKSKMKIETDKIDDAFSSGKISKEDQISQKEIIARKYENSINEKVENQRNIFDEITKNTVKESVYNNSVNNGNAKNGEIFLGLNGLSVNVKKKNHSPKDYLISKTLTVSYGFMNLTKDSGSFNPFENDSEMRIGNSHSIELQFRKEQQLGSYTSPWFIRYGLAYRTDTYMPKRPQVFVENNSELYLDNFSQGSLKRSKLRNVYLTIPVEFELVLNPKYTEFDGKSYLDAKQKQWKIGLGAYAGVRTRTIDKVKYYDANDKFKKYDFTVDNGVNSFLFGGKFSIGYGGFNLFIKKDFTPIFNSSALIPSKNGIQVGIEIMNLDF